MGAANSWRKRAAIVSGGKQQVRRALIPRPARAERVEGRPYFNLLYRIEIVQNGKTVFEHIYGRKGGAWYLLQTR